ncbi:MAG: glutamate--tRNA ligase [Clostridia bacterium]|nr:glutamate--tRNA ligase [Clostridia bacterium]
MTEVRTRFAPSPTGYLHIGGLRTALYAWLFARNANGKFILRIEDTDRQREVEGATELIYRTMRETGLDYDEGPDIGGPVGPYIQTQRQDLYKKYADMLVDCGGAYYCFCTKEELDAKREAVESAGGTYRYDRACMDIPVEEARRRIAAGEPYVVRQRIPDSGEAFFDDLVFGRISVPVEELEDGVLLKTDGLPTYNFANVVDDSLMGITHIIRGTEYLSSTPKYNLIYQAYGWDIPQYIHVPPVMRDAQHKLSKRHGDASYEDFTSKGYLKDAILNYIALLGWNPGTTQEIFTLEELQKAFHVEGLSKSPAIFDVAKLNWMNAEYIRALSAEAFTENALPWYRKVLEPTAEQCSILCRILQPRLEIFGQIPEKIVFLAALPEYEPALFEHKKMKTDQPLALRVLKSVLPKLEAEPVWTEEAVHAALLATVAELGVKNGQVFWPVRIALTGMAVSPGGADEAAALLGREEGLRRLRFGIELLEKNA